MSLKNIRHLREILITDAQGKTTSTMQYSSQNASHFRPAFVEVPFQDQTKARELYLRLGGRRREDMRIGTTVILPNRKDA
jgi:hypothetical protein